jgi:hypothetical protein
MSSTTLLRCIGLFGPTLLIPALTSVAQQPFPLPVVRPSNVVPERVVRADFVVMGKVTAIEDKRVAASGPANLPGVKVAYKIAVVKVTEVLSGPRDRATIRVGFLPDPELAVGQEACFLLVKHAQEDFFVPAVNAVSGCPPASVFIDKNSPDFKEQLALVKRCARLLADPGVGLKSKDAEDRFLTAAMLVLRYRSYPGDGRPVKKEPLGAAESKLILEALRDADWTKQYPETWLTPSAVFNHLHLDPGVYNPSNKGADPQKWLRENAARYRIERLVRIAGKT